MYIDLNRFQKNQKSEKTEMPNDIDSGAGHLILEDSYPTMLLLAELHVIRCELVERLRFDKIKELLGELARKSVLQCVSFRDVWQMKTMKDKEG